MFALCCVCHCVLLLDAGFSCCVRLFPLFVLLLLQLFRFLLLMVLLLLLLLPDAAAAGALTFQNVCAAFAAVCAAVFHVCAAFAASFAAFLLHSVLFFLNPKIPHRGKHATGDDRARTLGTSENPNW